MDDEQHLPGGRTVGAVRPGDADHRPVQPWTATVHALLRHLAAVGFAGAPRVLAGVGALQELCGEQAVVPRHRKLSIRGN